MRDRDDDAARLARFLERHQLTSVMNDTKWEELVAAMRAFPPPVVEWQAKDLRAAAPGPWDAEWYYHLRPFRTLEWVDVRIRRGGTAEQASAPADGGAAAAEGRLRATLLSLGIPFSLEGGNVRIWGYTRPGRQPAWLRARAT